MRCAKNSSRLHCNHSHSRPAWALPDDTAAARQLPQVDIEGQQKHARSRERFLAGDDQTTEPGYGADDGNDYDDEVGGCPALYLRACVLSLFCCFRGMIFVFSPLLFLSVLQERGRR